MIKLEGQRAEIEQEVIDRHEGCQKLLENFKSAGTDKDKCDVLSAIVHYCQKNQEILLISNEMGEEIKQIMNYFVNSAFTYTTGNDGYNIFVDTLVSQCYSLLDKCSY